MYFSLSFFFYRYLYIYFIYFSRWPQRKRTINQLDGPNDEKEAPKKRSSEDQWEQHRKELRKLRLRSSSSSSSKKVVAQPKVEGPSTKPALPSSEPTKTKSALTKEKYRKLENTFRNPSSKRDMTTPRSTEAKRIVSVPKQALSSNESVTKRAVRESTRTKTSKSEAAKDKKVEKRPSSFFCNNSPSPIRDEPASLLRSISSPQRYKPVSFFRTQSDTSSCSSSKKSSSPVPRKRTKRSSRNTSRNSTSQKREKVSEDTTTFSSSASPPPGADFIQTKTLPVKEFDYYPSPPVLREEKVSKQSIVYQEPFFSKASDVPRYPTVFSGKEFRLSTRDINSLKEFKSTFQVNREKRTVDTTIKIWEPAVGPPSFDQVSEWAKENQLRKKNRIQNSITMVIFYFFFIERCTCCIYI